jgi:hypothetical protein
MIREELERLPESYRQPLKLCYLEGMTHEQAAGQLGWPVGTVKVRLVRGRRLMRERIDRRGVCLSGFVLAWLLKPVEQVSVPETLLDATVKLMSVASRYGVATLGSRVGEAARSSGFKSSVSTIRSFRWAWPVLVATVVALGVTGSTALGFLRVTSAKNIPMSLPDNLTDILNVDCH